jgi:ATP adenylyltransferase
MLCSATGVGSASEASAPHQALPYNLLLTREWMLLVPRARESVAGISINALGFGGSLFVKTPHQVEQIARLRPMAMLQHVAFA